jgi:hypothetical protein
MRAMILESPRVQGFGPAHPNYQPSPWWNNEEHQSNKLQPMNPLCYCKSIYIVSESSSSSRTSSREIYSGSHRSSTSAMHRSYMSLEPALAGCLSIKVSGVNCPVAFRAHRKHWRRLHFEDSHSQIERSLAYRHCGAGIALVLSL